MIVCEGRPLCVIKTLQVALYLVLFHLEYPIPAKNILCFLQDYILGHPDFNNKKHQLIWPLFLILSGICDFFFFFSLLNNATFDIERYTLLFHLLSRNPIILFR